MDSKQLNDELRVAIMRVTIEKTTAEEFEEVKEIALNLLSQNHKLRTMLGREMRRKF